MYKLDYNEWQNVWYRLHEKYYDPITDMCEGLDLPDRATAIGDYFGFKIMIDPQSPTTPRFWIFKSEEEYTLFLLKWL